MSVSVLLILKFWDKVLFNSQSNVTVSHSMESSLLRKRFKLEHFMHTYCIKSKKTLLTSFKSMASLSIASTTSRIKGHHVYEQINDGEEFSCSLEPGSSHSPSDNATTASALNEKLQKKKGLKHERLLVLASTKQGQCELYCLKSNEWPKPHHWHNTCFWKKNLEPDSEATKPKRCCLSHSKHLTKIRQGIQIEFTNRHWFVCRVKISFGNTQTILFFTCQKGKIWDWSFLILSSELDHV